MKSRCTRMMLISAYLIASPLLVLAGGQPEIHRVTKQEEQDRTGISRAVQQGKGGGKSVSNQVIRANAYRSETPEESRNVVQQSSTRSMWNDPAFHR